MTCPGCGAPLEPRRCSYCGRRNTAPPPLLLVPLSCNISAEAMTSEPGEIIFYGAPDHRPEWLLP